jgi:hypothetical protein
MWSHEGACHLDVAAGEALGQARLHECLGHVGVGDAGPA